MSAETATEKPLSSEPKKRGPKPKAEGQKSKKDELAEVKETLARLISAIEEEAHHKGTSNILVKHGFKRYQPTKDDMRKYNG